MVNSNPETVSTDYDTSDLLFFEPLTREDVLNICDRVQPGRRDRAVRRPDAAEPGRCRSKRRRADHRHRVDTIEDAEDREKFSSCSTSSGCSSRANGIARTMDEAASRSRARIGYPVLVRPSFVLGGRAMEIVYDEDQLRRLRGRAVDRRARAAGADRPLPRRRHRGRRRRHQRRRDGRRRPASWSTSKRPASTPATPPARCPPTRSIASCSTTSRHQAIALAARARRHRPDEHAVRGQRRTTSTSWRSTRAPAAPCRSSPRPPACRWPSSPQA